MALVVYLVHITANSGAKLKGVLDRIFPSFSADLEKQFNGWIPHFKLDTYLTCISEHLDSEDSIGRLSMWRAYGGRTGVAIVLKNGPFLTPSTALKAYSSPVGYFSAEQFKREFHQIADAAHIHADILSKLGREAIMTNIFNMFKFAMLCTKHPGFHEEREWRIVYLPMFEKSDRLIADLKVIGGVPQPIYRIPLKDVPDEGLVGIEIPQFFDRVIIGPTQYPAAIYEAFVRSLEQAGVTDAPNKVQISDIPLRQ
jgi:hypothetical protein